MKAGFKGALWAHRIPDCSSIVADGPLRISQPQSKNIGLTRLDILGELLAQGHSIPPEGIRRLPDNPKTALDRFLTENNDSETDRTIENKLLFTSNPGGYLRRRKKGE